MQPYHTEVGAGTSNPATLLRVLGPEPWRAGLRRAVHPARRRPLRREPVPLPAALPVPGDPEARARRRAGPVPRLAAGDRDPDRAARRAVRRGQLGEPEPGRVGPRLGGVDGRDGDHPVHLLPAGRRDRARPGVGRDHLRPRAARDAPPGRAPGPRHDVVAGRHVGRGARGGRAPVLGLQLRAGRHRRCSPATSTTTRPRRAGASRPGCRSSPTTTCSSARTRSTCSTPAGRSRSPTGPAYILRMRRLTQAVAAAHLDVGRRRGRCLTCSSRSAARSCPRRTAGIAEDALPGLFAAELERAGLPAERVGIHVAPRRLAIVASGIPERARGRAPGGARPARRRPRAGPGGVRAKARDRRRGARGARRVRVGDLRGGAGAGGRAAPGRHRGRRRRASSFRARCAGPAAASRGPSAGSWRSSTARSSPPRWRASTPRGESRGPRPGREPVPIGSAATYLDDLRAHGRDRRRGRAARGDRRRARRRRRLDRPDGQARGGRLPRRAAAACSRASSRPATSTCPSGSRSRRCSRTSATSRSAGPAGELEPRFLVVANGGDDDVVRRGNEEVLVGRLDDAAFAYSPRPGARPRGDGRRARPGQLPRGRRVAGREGGPARAARSSACATETSSAATSAPRRFGRPSCARRTSSRGSSASSRPSRATRARCTPRRPGEPDDVCAAIAEHHQPEEAGGELPANAAGAAVALADKGDTLQVAFAAGLEPTGSRDPYGLRRAAAGLVAIALDRGWRVDLPELAGERRRRLRARPARARAPRGGRDDRGAARRPRLRRDRARRGGPRARAICTPSPGRAATPCATRTGAAPASPATRPPAPSTRRSCRIRPSGRSPKPSRPAAVPRSTRRPSLAPVVERVLRGGARHGRRRGRPPRTGSRSSPTSATGSAASAIFAQLPG